MSILDGNGRQDGPYNSFLIACLLIAALPCWLAYECGVLVGVIDEEAIETVSEEQAPEAQEGGAPGTYCGSDQAETRHSLSPGWESHRCLSRGEAGEELWARCLSRPEYTDEPGRGCPGAERCCPEAGAL